MKLYTLENSEGVKTQITNYGGRVVRLFTPDKYGHFEDIVLGYDDLKSYLSSNEKYFGAIIGRYANGISKAKFNIESSEYILTKNDGENILHGGIKGFHNVLWDVKQPNKQTLELSYLSKDKEEGFPGNLNVRVVYSLTNDNGLKIEYFATTDKPTVVNLTHHSFFNLTGNANETIKNHTLQILADFFTPQDEGMIPTGEITPVEGTPFDFRKPTLIGDRIDSENEQLRLGKGYDHNWVIDKNGTNKKNRLIARATEPESGRIMEVYTNEPGIEFYSGNFLNGTDVGKNNIAYQYRTAFCLETQHFPDSPNKENFPSTLLRPGEEYYSICIYKFSVK
jgi:aldose 1-epimerase